MTPPGEGPPHPNPLPRRGREQGEGGPLDGVRVVDLTSYIAGSYGAMMLADLGADVVKVEAIEGDSFRELSGFYGWNRGKRSLAVNLKEPDGRAIVHRLARHADVVMENMRPGVVERLGVDYETLRAINPRLVYSTVTAFGSDGPYKDRPGFDPLLQAMGGLMTLQGFGEAPQYLRIAPTDYYCAALACQAILAALFVRERTGRGQRVQTSLLQAVLALQSGLVVDYPGHEVVYRNTPTYRLYQAGDGESFFLAVRQPVVLGEALQGDRPRGPGPGPALRLLGVTPRQRGGPDAAAGERVRVPAGRGVGADPHRQRHPGAP